MKRLHQIIRFSPFATVLIGASILYLIFIRRSSFWTNGKTYYSLFDDAMVSMRYAKNFAEGFGLVWNPGEPAVEGYTNFLWTLILSVPHWFGFHENETSLTVMLLGLLLLLANLWIIRLTALKLTNGSELVSVMAAAMTALFYPLIFWTLRGMEVGLIVALFNLSIYLCFQLETRKTKSRLVALCITLAILPLIRMDTVLLVGVTLLYLALNLKKTDRASVLLPLIALCSSTLILHIMFRWFYYHEWLPNTFYLKLGSISTWERLTVGANAFVTITKKSLLPLLALGSLALFFPRIRILFLLSIFMVQALYSMYVGGDAWEWMGFANRFITVGASALILCGCVQLHKVLSLFVRTVWLERSVFVVLCLLSTYFVNKGSFERWSHLNFHHYYDDSALTAMALHIKKNTQPDARVAVVRAGTIPYFANRPMIDMLGKSDPIIARGPSMPMKEFYPGHTKWNYKYSIGDLKPDLIVELWNASEEDHKYVASLGYTKLPNGLWLLESSRRVDRSGIGQFWN